MLANQLTGFYLKAIHIGTSQLTCCANATGQYLAFNGLTENEEKVYLRPAATLKKRLQHRCFPVNFVKFFRASFFTEHLRWLLLCIFMKSKDLYTTRIFGIHYFEDRNKQLIKKKDFRGKQIEILNAIFYFGFISANFALN